MMTSTTRTSRAIPIRRVPATCRVPLGLKPVTAATAVINTARASHPNQLMTTTAYNAPSNYRTQPACARRPPCRLLERARAAALAGGSIIIGDFILGFTSVTIDG